jgi:hypothetical protein
VSSPSSHSKKTSSHCHEHLWKMKEEKGTCNWEGNFKGEKKLNFFPFTGDVLQKKENCYT